MGDELEREEEREQVRPGNLRGCSPLRLHRWDRRVEVGVVGFEREEEEEVGREELLEEGRFDGVGRVVEGLRRRRDLLC